MPSPPPLSPSTGHHSPRGVHPGRPRGHCSLHLCGRGRADPPHLLEAQLGPYPHQPQVGQPWSSLNRSPSLPQNFSVLSSSCAYRVSFASENGQGTLVIQDVKEADQGAYTCEAINARGMVFGIPDGVLSLTPDQGELQEEEEQS